MNYPLKIIIDFDGTLTAEEQQVTELAEMSLAALAQDIIGAPLHQLAADYQATRSRLLQAPHRYCWEVNSLVASYSDEGAFILNTTTLQVMLRESQEYARAVAAAFPRAEYDPVVDCTNHLFHYHTAEISPIFRPAAREVLLALVEDPQRRPVILTNSLDEKVHRHLGALELGELEGLVTVLGDTRQYDMDPEWTHTFPHPERCWERVQAWPVDDLHSIDLRRPVYYRALGKAACDGSGLAVVADTLSLPGALPLLMGIPFFLLRTGYTPQWCADAVRDHPLGYVLDDLAGLPAALDELYQAE